MINGNAWTEAARNGQPFERCPSNHRRCEGWMVVRTEPDGSRIPFTDHTDPKTGLSTRWFEARCNTCGAVFAYPAGKDANDADRRHGQARAERQGITDQRDHTRVGEFVGGYTGGPA